MTLPAGYRAVGVDTPGAHAFAWGDVGAVVEGLLARHGTLRGWSAACDDAVQLTGRGRVAAVPAPAPGPDARPRWVVRPYLRGGAVARFLGDRYLRVGTPRPLREAAAAAAARDRGIPTPAVVAGAVYPAGPFHYRADLVTELVPDGVDLAAALLGGREVGRTGRLLEATGALLARTAAAGLLHPDLNAKNLVIRDEPNGPVAYLIDLDRCRVRPRAVPGDETVMRSRLVRSLEKLAARGAADGRTPPAFALDDAVRALDRGIAAGRSAREGSR